MDREMVQSSLVARALASGQPTVVASICELPEADLIAHAGDATYAVVVRSVPRARSEEVTDAVARASLQARWAAQVLGMRPLAVVVAPRVGRRAGPAVGEFMARYAPDVAWLLVDPEGGRASSLPWLADVAPAPKPRGQATGQRRPSHLFSDRNQWLLKLLLLRSAPPEHWSGPRGPIKGVPMLARIGGVSTQTAYDFAGQMADRGFLRTDSGGLRLVRREELIEAWLADQRLRPPRRWPVRGLIGPCRDLADRLGAAQGVVGGFEACQRHGWLHAALAGSPEVHALAEVPDLVAEFDLELCDDRDAEAVLLQGRARSSVRHGALRLDAALVVDPVQAALDVVTHPARGLEQARFVLDRVVAWDDF